MAQPPAGTRQCFPSTSNDPNVRALYQSDGVSWIYQRDIIRNQCPRFSDHIVDLASQLTASYVSQHSLPAAELPNLLTNVHQALVSCGEAVVAVEEKPPKLLIPIKKTVTPDAIYSLEDGKPYQSLKRHLSVRGLTPKTYRAKWGLPTDYPMTAHNYGKRRSELAKKLGLGRGRHAGTPPATPPKAGRHRKPT